MPLPEPNHTAQDYWNLPEDAHVELIDGRLLKRPMPSRKHQEIVSEIHGEIRSHIKARGGSCKVYPGPFAVNLFADDTTFVEPDISVVCDRDKLSDRGCIGAPDLIVEVVSPSNPDMDYISKLRLYYEAGVREYWICDPIRERTLRYAFEDDLMPTAFAFAEPVPSFIFPNFEVNLAEIVAGM